MEDTSKYLIHADVTADGVVERSDVVGAIFGQTEGLLGDELDLRDLRQSQKVGRIDVEITSTQGQSQGHLTIATSLDKVETATLAAALETITHVGPCRADLEVTEIEDVRAAKRKEVVERAQELLETGFDDSVMSSEEILAEVRQHVRVEAITEYEGLPAGPRATDSDAIIVVEGRSDVRTLLKYGIKNAIAVEGTNVPDAVAGLTADRTVTAFLDGDRGGDLILEELAQVGDVDFVAFAPAESSVEDLDHHELFTALRNKVPYDSVAGLNVPREAVAATDGSTTPAPPPRESPAEPDAGRESGPDADGGPSAGGTASGAVDGAGTAEPDVETNAETESGAPPVRGEGAGTTVRSDADGDAVGGAAASATATGGDPELEEDGVATATDDVGSESPATIYGHAREIVREETGRVRFLDADGGAIKEAPAGEAYATLEGLESDPTAVVLDGVLEQRLLDLAADRGVDRIVARELGQFTKRPTDVRIHAIDEIAERAPETN